MLDVVSILKKDLDYPIHLHVMINVEDELWNDLVDRVMDIMEDSLDQILNNVTLVLFYE